MEKIESEPVMRAKLPEFLKHQKLDRWVGISGLIALIALLVLNAFGYIDIPYAKG